MASPPLGGTSFKNIAPSKPPNKIDPSSALILPKICTSKVACTYNVMGKCKGMFTPERFSILYKAFHDTKLAGIHGIIMPPPKSFDCEL